ncbi:MAG: hypothetical protein IPH76_15135 [Xanthomonadales bacterium]|nr:hypothetical protein [Xanthomonadales bacterium]
MEDRGFQRDAKLILQEAFIASLGDWFSSEWISSFSNESIDSGAFRRGEGYRFTLSAKVERDGWSRLRRDPNSDQAAWRSELLRLAKVIAEILLAY